MKKIQKITNGGQTGVERGALDEAINHNIQISGWCNKNGYTDDCVVKPGIIKKYPQLKEQIGEEEDQYLEFNIMDADAVIILTTKTVNSKRVNLAKEYSFRYKKTVFLIKEAKDVPNCAKWIDSLDRNLIINVTGPTAKECPNGYKLSREVLHYLFTCFKYD